MGCKCAKYQLQCQNTFGETIMISKKVQAALLGQLQMEFVASYSYLGMATYCRENSLAGFGNFFAKQSEEERAHAMKIYDYLLETDAGVSLGDVKSAKTSYESILDVLKAAYKQEQEVTKSINKIYDLAVSEKDNASSAFLQWFISEQVEEEASMRDAIEQLELAGDSKSALLILDREYAGK